jgi:putative sigma-54 modulation protein
VTKRESSEDLQIMMTARHCEIDAGTRQFAEERLEKLQKYARDLREAHLVVTAEKYRHQAEITLKLKSRDMVSHEESTEMRAAIDLAADTLEEQLRRLKGKRVDRKRHAPSANGIDPTAPVPGEVFEFEEDESAGEEG